MGVRLGGASANLFPERPKGMLWRNYEGLLAIVNTENTNRPSLWWSKWWSNLALLTCRSGQRIVLVVSYLHCHSHCRGWNYPVAPATLGS